MFDGARNVERIFCVNSKQPNWFWGVDFILTGKASKVHDPAALSRKIKGVQPHRCCNGFCVRFEAVISGHCRPKSQELRAIEVENGIMRIID
jgi:hypothetical protein